MSNNYASCRPRKNKPQIKTNQCVQSQQIERTDQVLCQTNTQTTQTQQQQKLKAPNNQMQNQMMQIQIPQASAQLSKDIQRLFENVVWINDSTVKIAFPKLSLQAMQKQDTFQQINEHLLKLIEQKLSLLSIYEEFEFIIDFQQSSAYMASTHMLQVLKHVFNRFKRIAILQINFSRVLTMDDFLKFQMELLSYDERLLLLQSLTLSFNYSKLNESSFNLLSIIPNGILFVHQSDFFAKLESLQYLELDYYEHLSIQWFSKQIRTEEGRDYITDEPLVGIRSYFYQLRKLYKLKGFKMTYYYANMSDKIPLGDEALTDNSILKFNFGPKFEFANKDFEELRESLVCLQDNKLERNPHYTGSLIELEVQLVGKNYYSQVLKHICQFIQGACSFELERQENDLMDYRKTQRKSSSISKLKFGFEQQEDNVQLSFQNELDVLKLQLENKIEEFAFANCILGVFDCPFSNHQIESLQIKSINYRLSDWMIQFLGYTFKTKFGNFKLRQFEFISKQAFIIKPPFEYYYTHYFINQNQNINQNLNNQLELGLLQVINNNKASMESFTYINSLDKKLIQQQQQKCIMSEQDQQSQQVIYRPLQSILDVQKVFNIRKAFLYVIINTSDQIKKRLLSLNKQKWIDMMQLFYYI